MHSYLLHASYKFSEYVHIVPRDTIPFVVVIVIAYVPVLSGNVGGVDIVTTVVRVWSSSVCIYICPLYYTIYKVYHYI